MIKQDIRKQSPWQRETGPDSGYGSDSGRCIERARPYIDDLGMRQQFGMGSGQAARTHVLPMHCPASTGQVAGNRFARAFFRNPPEASALKSRTRLRSCACNCCSGRRAPRAEDRSCPYLYRARNRVERASTPDWSVLLVTVRRTICVLR